MGIYRKSTKKVNFGNIPLIYREISSWGSNPSKALHTCLTDMCANTHLFSHHFLTCSLYEKIFARKLFSPLLPQRPPSQKFLLEQKCVPLYNPLFDTKRKI